VKFRHWNAWMLGLAMVAGGAAAQAPAADPSVLFMADAQIHNVYGGEVKQTWGVSDWFSGVAQRHPEMNLLSGYALQDFLARGEQQAGPGAAPFAVMLGDATNAACTGEFERFMQAAKGGNPNRILLIAHGNHDSYLMGTVNYWQAPLDGIDLARFRDGALPPDASWWPDIRLKEGAAGQGWLALCHQSRGKSAPMNKIQWMAKYLQSLAVPSADGTSALEPGVAGKDKATFSGRGKPGTALGAVDYRVKGEWIRPTTARHGLADTYDSFLVQAVDVGARHRLILVDTAACAWYQRGWWARLVPRFGVQNAGLSACMGEAQRDVIREFATSARNSGRTVVFAGHHPLKDFLKPDLAAFETIMNEASGPGWVYVSAHTHDPFTDQDRGNGARELNISSTTDWPMSASLISFGARLERAPVELNSAPIAYTPPDYYPNGPELCRHYDAARKLQGLDLADTSYASPGTKDSYKTCIEGVRTDWEKYDRELHAAEDEIARRMADPRYRQRALEIMAAASRHEHETPSADKIKIR
jgi:hypothetical protein